jgi:hypothetical protein
MSRKRGRTAAFSGLPLGLLLADQRPSTPGSLTDPRLPLNQREASAIVSSIRSSRYLGFSQIPVHSIFPDSRSVAIMVPLRRSIRRLNEVPFSVVLSQRMMSSLIDA